MGADSYLRVVFGLVAENEQRSIVGVRLLYFLVHREREDRVINHLKA